MGLYRPTVTKKRKDGTRYTIKSRRWWGSFHHPATDEAVRVPLKTRDRSAALILLREAERRAALEHAGLVSPFEKHHERPLLEHVDDFEQELRAKGTTVKHATLVSFRVRRVVRECDFNAWPDVSASAVITLVGKLRDGDVSAQTRNFYVQAIKQFARWMVAAGRAADSPIALLKAENVKTDRRHDRRAFDDDELRSLLETTRNNPTRFGLTGSDRAMLYRLVAETGLRAGEIRSLIPKSFRLDDIPPTIAVAAAYSKRRQEDILPLRPELAADLADFLAGRDPGVPAFIIPEKSAKMVRADLADARSSWINNAGEEREQQRRERSSFLVYRDEAGRVVDFHALRHTFITNLARGGAHPKVAQSLARHSTITLTMDRYTHVVLGEQAEALRNLPDVSKQQPDREQRRATGTCDARLGGSHGVCTGFAQTGAISRRSESSIGTLRPTGVQGSDPRNQPKECTSDTSSHHLAPSATTATGRIRTNDLRFTKPLLCQLSYGGAP